MIIGAVAGSIRYIKASQIFHLYLINLVIELLMKIAMTNYIVGVIGRGGGGEMIIDDYAAVDYPVPVSTARWCYQWPSLSLTDSAGRSGSNASANMFSWKIFFCEYCDSN